MKDDLLEYEKVLDEGGLATEFIRCPIRPPQASWSR